MKYIILFIILSISVSAAVFGVTQEQTQEILTSLQSQQTAIQPIDIVLRKGLESQIAIGFTNKKEDPANFSIRVLPLNETDDLQLGYAHHSTTLKQGDKRITPVFVKSDVSGIFHMKATLYRDDKIIAAALFNIEVQENPWYTRFWNWIKNIFKP